MRKFILSAAAVFILFVSNTTIVDACPSEVRVQRSRQRVIRQPVRREKVVVRQPIRRERVVVEEYYQSAPQQLRRERVIVEDNCQGCQQSQSFQRSEIREFRSSGY